MTNLFVALSILGLILFLLLGAALIPWGIKSSKQIKEPIDLDSVPPPQEQKVSTALTLPNASLQDIQELRRQVDALYEAFQWKGKSAISVVELKEGPITYILPIREATEEIATKAIRPKLINYHRENKD